MDYNDVVFNILLRLNHKDLLNLCLSYNKYYTLCHDPYFLQEKTIYDKLPLYVGYPKTLKEYEKLYKTVYNLNQIYNLINQLENISAALFITIYDKPFISLLPTRLINKIKKELVEKPLYLEQVVVLYDVKWGTNPKHFIGYQNENIQMDITTTIPIKELLFNILYNYPHAILKFEEFTFLKEDGYIIDLI
jgi:hypothetical protein